MKRKHKTAAFLSRFRRGVVTDPLPRNDLQPLVDETAWNLVARRNPPLARAMHELLESGETPARVVDLLRPQCGEEALRPVLACAVAGCERSRHELVH